MFSATVPGAKANANLYSLIETVKANGLPPYPYLRHVFTELPKVTAVQQMEALLPWQIDQRTVTAWIENQGGVYLLTAYKHPVKVYRSKGGDQFPLPLN